MIVRRKYCASTTVARRSAELHVAANGKPAVTNATRTPPFLRALFIFYFFRNDFVIRMHNADTASSFYEISREDPSRTRTQPRYEQVQCGQKGAGVLASHLPATFQISSRFARLFSHKLAEHPRKWATVNDSLRSGTDEMLPRLPKRWVGRTSPQWQ